jgi:hypothetical protein
VFILPTTVKKIVSKVGAYKIFEYDALMPVYVWEFSDGLEIKAYCPYGGVNGSYPDKPNPNSEIDMIGLKSLSGKVFDNIFLELSLNKTMALDCQKRFYPNEKADEDIDMLKVYKNKRMTNLFFKNGILVEISQTLYQTLVRSQENPDSMKSQKNSEVIMDPIIKLEMRVR